MIRNILTIAASCAAAITVCTTSVSAQGKCDSYVLDDGTILTCAVDANGAKVYVDDQGNSYPGTPTSVGSGEFEIIDTQTNPCQARLKVRDIKVESDAGDLGIIETSVDDSRQSTPSTIRANGKQLLGNNWGGGAKMFGDDDDEGFPATEDIYFYAKATLSSKPGDTYRSDQELHLKSENVRTFNPHVNETFELQGKVDFRKVDADGNVSEEIAFTLESATVTLNGEAEGDGEGE